MTTKRWVGLALVVLVALAGCKKKEAETPPPAATPPAAAQPATPAAAQPAPAPAPETAQPAQPTPSATAPAAAPGDSAQALRALHGSFGQLGAGLGAGFGDLMEGKAAEEGGQPSGEHNPPPIQRMQVHLDIAALRASPLGGLLDAGLGIARAKAAEDDAKKVCIVDLLGKISSGYLDVTLGPDGEPSSLVVSIKSTAAKDDVVNCMKGAADSDEQFIEVPVGDRTGYTMKKADEEPKFVLVESTPGNWLFGMKAAVEAGLAADPETDATFQAMSAPLGPSFARMTVVFKPEIAALASTIGADAPAQAQCLRDVFTHLKGASAGLRLTPDFTLSLAVQNGSPAEAAATQSCLSTLWDLVKPVLLSKLGPEETSQAQMMLGMTPTQFLDLVKIETAADFAKVSVSLPGDFLGKVTQMLGSLMQMAGGMHQGMAPEEPPAQP